MVIGICGFEECKPAPPTIQACFGCFKSKDVTLLPTPFLNLDLLFAFQLLLGLTGKLFQIKSFVICFD